MRKSLLSTFDKIYIYDLHGSAKRKETAPDGSKDENVFDIQQGVSICFFIKTKSNSTLKEPEVLFHEQFGKRNFKYEQLVNEKINTIPWTVLNPSEPHYFFVPKTYEGNIESEFERGFSLSEMFIQTGNGIKFRKDNLLVKDFFSTDDVKTMLSDINELASVDIYKKYNFKETPDWKVDEKKALFENYDPNDIIKVSYRQFDSRFTYYPLSKINQIIVRGDSRRGLMKNYLHGDNVGLVVGRQGQVVGNMQWNLIFISNMPTDMNIFYRGGGINFPLYVYPENIDQTTIGLYPKRQPNLSNKIVLQIANTIGLKFTPEKEVTSGTFAPIDILDYIYAVLHSPSYREKYKEFLKIDFPRVPYPTNTEEFWSLVELGGKLRQTHLLESADVENYITSYPENGNNVVDKPKYENGNVYINDTQYFADVPQTAWEFYIGGYQPAQKWLKDRKGRELSFEDILHYQKIIVALTETGRLMKEIDEVLLVSTTQETTT
ncbi:hypothetical protein C8E01_1022 [Pontibacter virosus]|uniref:Type ISP restriction-modification enzyme LLaBIII C-terminal specificity domain-containing protein n=2 Tax=Pontibacter virosus TaxID=1765052 RepID=A0A2U1B2C9_9BACT|nr:hypothetical protein C8E01_1022 [Pontibacter virosus]